MIRPQTITEISVNSHDPTKTEAMIHRKRTNGTIIRKLPEDGLYIQIYLYISAGFVMLAIVIMQAAPSEIPPHHFIRTAKPADNTASTAMNFLLCYTDNFYYSLKTGTKVNVSLHILKKNQSKKKKTIRKNCLYTQDIYRQMQQKSFDNRHLHFQPTNSDKYGEMRRTQHYRRPDIPDSRKTPIRPNSHDRPGFTRRAGFTLQKYTDYKTKGQLSQSKRARSAKRPPPYVHDALAVARNRPANRQNRSGLR